MSRTRSPAEQRPAHVGLEIPMTTHALKRYHERTPDDAVDPGVAWQRGEDVQHPGVVRTEHHDVPPTRVRVYNHDQEWFAIFVCDDKADGVERIVTVYDGQTHEHGPTRAYLYSHGPHWSSDEGDLEEADTDD